MKILILNGPNMNLLGLREPALYGRDTYEDLVALAEKTCREEGLRCVCVQSNHEGVLIDEIQKAREDCGGIVINPAAYSHTSIAMADALRAVALPAVEVHISDVDSREAFRHISYAGKACVQTYKGLGFDGYVQAIRFLKQYLTEGRV